MVETFRAGMKPAFVERLDAWELAATAGLDLPPVMIYGDDVTHLVTEEGIAHLLRCRGPSEREAAVRAVAGFTPVGRGRDRAVTADLRRRGIVQRAADLGIDPREATRDLLAARSTCGNSSALVRRALPTAETVPQLVAENVNSMAEEFTFTSDADDLASDADGHGRPTTPAASVGSWSAC